MIFYNSVTFFIQPFFLDEVKKHTEMQVITFFAINNKATTLGINNIYFSHEVTLKKLEFRRDKEIKQGVK